jgi:hypothetical protein
VTVARERALLPTATVINRSAAAIGVSFLMAKGSLNYPRYKPNPLRPPGTGAFFDYVVGVSNRDARKLKSCSLMRRWGKAAPPAQAEAVVERDDAPLGEPSRA